MDRLKKITALVERVGTIDFLNTKFDIIVAFDKKIPNGRIYVQISYLAICTKTKKLQKWNGRKYYLSDYMTDDEVIKTCYFAFETAIKHEVMEAFKVDGITLFNPHLNFEELLKISNKEIKRNNETH